MIQYITISKFRIDVNRGAIGADTHWRIIGNDITAIKESSADGQVGSGPYHVDTPHTLPLSEYIYILGNSLHGGASGNKLDHSIYPGSGTSHLEIAWNHIYDNNFAQGPMISINHNEAFAKQLTSTNIKIHDNYIDVSKYPSRVMGTYELGAGSEIFYYNNIIQGSSEDGFSSVYAVSGALHYYNNTLYKTGAGNLASTFSFYCSDIYEHHYCPDSIELKNNIIYSSETAARYIRNTTDNGMVIDNNYNDWFGIGSFENKSVNITLGENSFNNVNPQFSTDNPQVLSDFLLQDTSPMVNAGVTVSTVMSDFIGLLRPQGNAFDIGALEQPHK